MTRPTWSTSLIAAAALLLAVPAASAQQSFQSPEDAVAALAAAAKSGATSDILKVLGNKAADIVESGDVVADKATRERFAAAYDDKHSISMEGDKKAILILGKDDFPFPIPLRHSRSGWEFDAAEGRIEILYRRIGRNELEAIQTARAFVDAENEYADKDRGAGPASTLSASSPAPARRTASIGRRTATRARSVSSQPRRPRKATRSAAASRSLITVTTIAS